MSGSVTIFGDPAEVGATFAASVRFQAPNGAVVTVTIPRASAPLDRERLLTAAWEAIAQLALQAGFPKPTVTAPGAIADCGAAFWSWASPQNA